MQRIREAIDDFEKNIENIENCKGNTIHTLLQTARKVLECEGLVEKKNIKCLCIYENDCRFVSMHYNSALDLFPVMMAKKCLTCRDSQEKKQTERTDSICGKGWEHPCRLNVNDGYCCAEECQFKVYPILAESKGDKK